jgi:hypothetical protein
LNFSTSSPTYFVSMGLQSTVRDITLLAKSKM